MNEKINIFLTIKSIYPSLNEIETTIADYILASPEKIIYSSISDLSEILMVSESSIFRFCKKIGFKGYQIFKISLASYLTEMNLDKNSAEPYTEETVVQRVFSNTIETLIDTRSFLEFDKISRASEMILNARKVLFCGNGGSGIVALDAQHKFIRLGLNVQAFSDNHMQLMAASQLGDKDLIILISHSGSNIDMLNLVDLAQIKNTKTIGITSYSRTPLCNKVDIDLSVISQETKSNFEAFASRIGHLTILDALYAMVYNALAGDAKISVDNMRKAISFKRV